MRSAKLNTITRFIVVVTPFVKVSSDLPAAGRSGPPGLFQAPEYPVSYLLVDEHRALTGKGVLAVSRHHYVDVSAVC